MKKPYFKYLPVLCISILLSACGGGGGSNSSSPDNTLTGVFIDSPVQGLRWVSGGVEGTTDAAGTFRYKSGATVQFYVGDILLGEATGDSILTPIDLIAGASDSSNFTVTNIIRFLMSLDDDDTPSNGIEIIEAVVDLTQGETVNFAQSTSDFTDAGDIRILVANLTAARNSGARPLTAVSDAQSHFSSSMGSLITGTYSGTWGGDSSGTWTVSVDSTGAMSNGTGTGLEGLITFSGGSVNTNGSGLSTFGTASDGSVFSGTVGLDGTMSGTWSWTDGFDSASGTYSGSKTSG